MVEFIEARTIIVPVEGGSYAEAVVGQPIFINPVLANSDVDRDLVELVFSSLSDMAESSKVSEDGKTWHYRLKDDIYWQDGEKITSDDIIFTINLVQDPENYSSLSQSWQGVVANRVSEREIELRLPTAYAFFQNTLDSFKPIPKHIFVNVPAANLKLSSYNLEPIGSGIYKFSDIRKRSNGYINFYNLIRNEKYFSEKPYIKEINFSFYVNEAEAVAAFNSGEVDSMGMADYGSLQQIVFPHQVFNLQMSKYYAIFLNNYSHPALKEKSVRIALNLATDKKEIIEKVFNGQAIAADGPFIAGVEKSSEENDINKAIGILESNGWQLNGDNIREKKIDKESIKLEFVLAVPDVPYLVKTAELISQRWSRAGIKLNLSVLSLFDINNKTIKTRDYQMVLFGNTLGKNPDIFSFWHSSEKFYPGLNLSLYENKTADEIIESLRKNFNEKRKQSDSIKLQSIIAEDQPAIFLYSPYYFYAVKKNIFGFDFSDNQELLSFPNDRFKNIEKWYVKTARVFK